MNTAKTPSVSITITGHRIDKAALLSSPKFNNQLRNFGNAFSEALADEMGVFIGGYLRSGEWWISRSKRFTKYRAWIKLRYGSDRNRKAGGSRRSALNSHSRVNLEEADMAQWGNIQHLMTQWLIKKLKSASVVSQGKYGKPKVYITGLTTKSTHLDISAALDYMERISAKAPSAAGYQRRDGSHVTARQHRMDMLNDIINDASQLNKLRQSRYGQRLWQMAEREAIKKLREQEARKHSPAPKSKREALKNHTVGQFKWGFQTGKFADAWNTPTWKKTMEGNKLIISLMPLNDGSQMNAWRLTQILQAKIRHQGGQGRLVPAQRVSPIVRRALRTVVSEGKLRGLSIRLRK